MSCGDIPVAVPLLDGWDQDAAGLKVLESVCGGVVDVDGEPHRSPGRCRRMQVDGRRDICPCGVDAVVAAGVELEEPWVRGGDGTPTDSDQRQAQSAGLVVRDTGLGLEGFSERLVFWGGVVGGREHVLDGAGELSGVHRRHQRTEWFKPVDTTVAPAFAGELGAAVVDLPGHDRARNELAEIPPH